MDTSDIISILVSCLAISELLDQVSWIKANSIHKAIYNVLKALVGKKE